MSEREANKTMGAVMNKYIVQWDFRKYQGDMARKTEQNIEHAKNPIEAESIEGVKEILKSKNLNPFYWLIIPIEQFKTVVSSQDHGYRNLSENFTRF
jgi:hypothetical protein